MTCLPIGRLYSRPCFLEFSGPWSSLLERDKHLDRSNSQTTMELCHARVAKLFGFNTNTTAFCLGRSSLHLLLLKSSMAGLICEENRGTGQLNVHSRLPNLFVLRLNKLNLFHFLPLIWQSGNFSFARFSDVLTLQCHHHQQCDQIGRFSKVLGIKFFD